jgi:cytochrome c
MTTFGLWVALPVGRGPATFEPKLIVLKEVPATACHSYALQASVTVACFASIVPVLASGEEIMIFSNRLIGSAGVAVMMTVSAHAEGDPKRGEQVFNQCKPCHSLEPGKNGVGPSLHGLFGRKAGTVPGYNYSAAMKNSGVVWNEDTLKQYLADPHKFIPGDKMPFAGIKNEQQLDDLIAYLKEAAQ